MNVLALPDYSRANPYQRELAAAARRYGVETTLAHGVGERFGIWRSIQRAGHPDVLHLHWMDPFVGARSRLTMVRKSGMLLLQILMARRRGLRIVWTIHNVVGHESRHPRLERRAYRALAALTDACIVHSACAAGIVTRAYRLPPAIAARIHVVPHGSYIASYPNTVSRAEARRRLHLADDDRVFVCFGRLRAYKGVAELVRAFVALAAPATRLVIVGVPADASVDADLARAAGVPAVMVVPSFVAEADVQVYMNAADAVVLPQRCGLTSGSLVLAMSFGRAVVAPRVGYVTETVGEEGAVLYDPDGPDALRAALAQALELDLAAMGRANRARMERVPWSSVAAATCAVYAGTAGAGTVGSPP